LLTAREREVVEYATRGFTNREIATGCGTSPNTVRNQLARVYGKLGVANRAELTRVALSARETEPEASQGPYVAGCLSTRSK
jgi:DNA-binding NarL/FixJ family response regulator